MSLCNSAYAGKVPRRKCQSKPLFARDGFHAVVGASIELFATVASLRADFMGLPSVVNRATGRTMKRSVVKERDPHATLQARTLRHASCETLIPASRETRATRDPISTTNPGDDKPRDLETRDNRDPRGRVPIVCRMVRETRDRKNRMRRQTRETREPCAKPRARETPHVLGGAAGGADSPPTQSIAAHIRPDQGE